MKLEGRIWKDVKTKYWVADVPLLDISTQGRSRKQALAMIEDAIPIEAEKEALRIQAQPSREPGVFTVSASDPDSLIALLLKRQRTCRGLRAYGTWHAGSRPVRQRLTHSMNRANAPPHSENCGSCCTPSIPNWKPSSRPDNSLTHQTNLFSNSLFSYPPDSTAAPRPDTGAGWPRPGRLAAASSGRWLRQGAA